MKIMYVDLEFDYGLESRGINTIGQMGFKRSFEELGHTVTPFYYDKYLAGNLEQLQIDIKNFADEVKPDLVFFILFRDQFSKETLQYLKSKYKTINFFGDDSWRFDNFTVHYVFLFTYCMTSDKFSILKYHAIGVLDVISSQWAAIDDDRDIKPLPYKYDVSFIGGYNPYRAWFVKQLGKKGVKVHCFGNGWPNGPLSNDEMVKLFASSKINLNLSNSSSLDIRYLLAHPKNFAHTLHTKKNASQIKARNFEINYYAGFQLADYVASLEDYYEIGKEIACYASPDEAQLLCKYYLNNEQEREAIRDRGMIKARAQYTYRYQLHKVLEKIK